MRESTPLDVLNDVLVDVPDLIFAYTSDGRYLFLNHAASEFLHAKPIDVIGCHWSDLGYSAEVMEPLCGHVAEVASTGEAERHRFTATSKRYSRTFDISLTPLWSEEGNVLAVLAIAHDISEFFRPASLA